MSMDDQHGDGGEADDSVRVAEYVLGLLDPAEQAQMRARLAVEPLLRAELRLWRTRLSSLDDNFAETPAPAAVLDRVEARLFPASLPARRGFWQSLALWRGLAAACLVVAVVAVGYDVLAPRGLTGPELVAALEAQGSDVKVVAFYDAAAGTVRLAPLSGQPVPGKDYELWAIKGKNAPVSMGVIPVNATTTIKLSPSLQQGFDAGTVLALTLEQPGGSPTGVAQGPLVASGAATRI